VEGASLEGATTSGFVVNNYAQATSWVRDSKGNITTYRVPGQNDVYGGDNGSDAKGTNALGIITGFGDDGNYTFHGYIAIPCGHWCRDNDQGTTAATRVSPPPMVQHATTATQVDAGFPGALSPNLRHLMPWYRNVGAQPPK
jgi:hypothetical protein